MLRYILDLKEFSMLHHRTSAGEYSYSVAPVLHFGPEGFFHVTLHFGPEGIFQVTSSNVSWRALIFCSACVTFWT
jgi:hypothetical protein